MEMEEQTTPPRVDSLVDLHPYVLMKVLQTQSTPSMPQVAVTTLHVCIHVVLLLYI